MRYNSHPFQTLPILCRQHLHTWQQHYYTAFKLQDVIQVIQRDDILAKMALAKRRTHQQYNSHPFKSFPILCRQYLHTSDMNEWVSFRSFRNDILKEMFWAQFNSWGASPPCLFTIHTLKHAWQHFYFYNSAMIKTIQYIRSSSDLACFLFFQISLNSFHIDILASKTGVDNWIVRGITKWPQSKKAIMRHTAARFLLATFKKQPPPFQHMCMWIVELLVESKGNILLAFLLPKEQLNFTIRNNEAKTALCAAASRPL